MDNSADLKVGSKGWRGVTRATCSVPCLAYKSPDALSDNFYQINTKIMDMDGNKAKSDITISVFVIGEVESGAFLTTCTIPGVLQPTLNVGAAVAVALEGRKVEQGKPFLKVGKIHARIKSSC